MQYVITGNGFLKEVTEDKKLYGDKIFIDQTTGEAKVSGTDNKPVRFIIDLGESKTPKENNKEAQKWE